MPTAFSDPLAAFGVLALILGGVVLVVSSLPTRSEAFAQRVNFALPRAGSKSKVQAARGRLPATVFQKLPSLGGALTDAEHRQIVRMFSHLGVRADQAGLYFILCRIISTGVFGVATVVGTRHYGLSAARWWLPFALGIGGAVGGWLLPILVVGSLLKRRTKAIASGLASALDLLVVCVEAGLSLEDGLQRLAHELHGSQPALAEEFALTWAEINILPDRTKALLNFADRVDDPNVRSVVGMLSQSMRFGTPLAQSLRVGATEMRNDQMTKLEERANRLPALMTIPVMLFIMPTLFLIIGGPAALKIVDMFQGIHK